MPCGMCHCQRRCQSYPPIAKLALPCPTSLESQSLGSFIPVVRRGSGSADVLCCSSKTCEGDGMGDQLMYLSVASTGLGCD